MTRHFLTPLRTAVALTLLALAGSAWADGDERGPAVPPLPLFQQECGSCHLAFSPRLMSPQGWRQLMGGLSQHFGSDASLDAAATASITHWLAANATGKRATEAPPAGRITRSAWFQRKHREVAAATWQRPAVKSPTNCTACHGGAEQGNFNERDIRIPR